MFGMIDIVMLEQVSRRADVCVRLKENLAELDALGLVFPAIYVNQAISKIADDLHRDVSRCNFSDSQFYIRGANAASTPIGS